jgi:hypothetical protein
MRDMILQQWQVWHDCEHNVTARGTIFRPGGRGPGEELVAAIMKPISRGINITFKKPGALQKLVDAVSGLVPLDKIKQALKTTLYPQYAHACKAFEPALSKFGGAAGTQIVAFLQVGLCRTSCGIRQLLLWPL